MAGLVVVGATGGPEAAAADAAASPLPDDPRARAPSLGDCGGGGGTDPPSTDVDADANADVDDTQQHIFGRGLHSSTFQLNLSALYGIGGARRGCVARVMGVLGSV